MFIFSRFIYREGDLHWCLAPLQLSRVVNGVSGPSGLRGLSFELISAFPPFSLLPSLDSPSIEEHKVGVQFGLSRGILFLL